MVQHITRFLLELGAGFAYVGRQVPLEVGGEDFFIDLLFYHLKLRCYVVIELKATAFKPEHAGKLSFYLSAVDTELKGEHDAPTIGMVLCKGKNKVVAEYALRNISWRPQQWCNSPGTPTPATPGWAAHLRRLAQRLALQGVGRPVSLV